MQGERRTRTITVAIARRGAAPEARVFVNGDTGVVASEAVAGSRRVWIIAPYMGQDLELRWSPGPAGADGTWILGWANNGALRGRMDSAH